MGGFPGEWDDVRAAAAEVLREQVPHAAATWLGEAGGYGTGWSYRRNRIALEQIEFRMRYIHDVREPNLTTTILGQDLACPVMIAPMTASLNAIHGEETLPMLGRGARTAGIATSIGHPVTEAQMVSMASEGAPIFRAVKPLKDRDELAEVIRQARDAGCFALAIDVDAAAGLHAQNDQPKFARFVEPLRPDELETLIREAELSVFIKGVLSIPDAEAAVEAGADGVIVSNHGGHAFDYCPSSIEALPTIVDAVGDEVEIWFDSGVRRGTDILKALALGAEAVLIGRLAIWGLALGGAEGVAHVVDLLRAELRRSMILTGVASVEDVSPEILAL
jgi:isopentenyl diphosphate isomerase/L-lactate dehydrogenase-like FMN-dependent dehydrogenase